MLSPIRNPKIGQLNAGLLNAMAYFIKDPGSFHPHIWTKDSYRFGNRGPHSKRKKIQIQSGEGKKITLW